MAQSCLVHGNQEAEQLNSARGEGIGEGTQIKDHDSKPLQMALTYVPSILRAESKPIRSELYPNHHIPVGEVSVICSLIHGVKGRRCGCSDIATGNLLQFSVIINSPLQLSCCKCSTPVLVEVSQQISGREREYRDAVAMRVSHSDVSGWSVREGDHDGYWNPEWFQDEVCKLQREGMGKATCGRKDFASGTHQLAVLNSQVYVLAQKKNSHPYLRYR